MKNAKISLLSLFNLLITLSFNPAFTQFSEKKIFAGELGDVFGSSISFWEDYALISAFSSIIRDGAVYAFRKTPTGWVEEDILCGGVQGFLGYGIVLHDTLALTGSEMRPFSPTMVSAIRWTVATTWGREVSTGVYFSRFVADGIRETIKLVNID